MPAGKRDRTGGLSWRGRHEPGRRALTGYSHGAAGAGVALLELGAAVRDDTFKETGLAAFAYERRWYSAAQANWPDFRRSGGGRSRISQRFSTAWCHGAPGIALSRLRAMQLAPTPEIASELHAALGTTSQATAAMLDAPGTELMPLPRAGRQRGSAQLVRQWNGALSCLACRNTLPANLRDRTCAFARRLARPHAGAVGNRTLLPTSVRSVRPLCPPTLSLTCHRIMNRAALSLAFQL